MKKTKNKVTVTSGLPIDTSTISSTNDLFRTKQSINQKTERSEQDVKAHFREVLFPLTVIVILNLLFTFALLVR